MALPRTVTTLVTKVGTTRWLFPKINSTPKHEDLRRPGVTVCVLRAQKTLEEEAQGSGEVTLQSQELYALPEDGSGS